ncbi:oxidoreductase [Fusarium oxysporum II5]|uniref:2,4-dienoyl-CoA reductase [(3E)-enoyl-CoA-producing] n=4 Tax=Fusarium oxysporum species complex TaxID=171631 RepID=N1S9Z0_FUSC4|nr:2,4-dienoyl-CoA reductase (NADPH2) [Fusarium odoratissimum NRRL 54006]EMT71755.1 Peroxisomal 2,4-dienoyl-CoA reductase SPS19 [Fusarium odoratissimum]ENH63473.1 Peroxisomal 2,4-dienoyl-CoA reductase SPS19 [Fusarium oxysporum f. sp. cubense race 1]KAK2122142.1 oxidoreductase [Fusarium oxysporum II5]TVY74488.1 Peroxisomal 2,4-dienoyl-CoA reductase SPS19 [Fusarium oxysporum f. sp. cubense]EXL89967.1 2,4-dienoyl-CoA reductase (NADPH2) [Fusarium odoratissimum NRRL 54006]
MSSSQGEFVSKIWQSSLFDDRVVFCTGGSGTICFAQVKALVHLGADACIVGRNSQKTEKMAQAIAKVRAGSKVIGIGNIDVRKLEALEGAVSQCVRELGGIDFVIAGAAGNFLAPIDGLSANAFKSVVDIDLLGSYNTLKSTLPYLLASAARNRNPGSPTGGRIIFVSATFHYTGVPYQSHVAAAKAGVDALSASVALEYGPRGLTSNVISPGGIEGTEGLQRLSSEASRESGQAARNIPLGRYGLLKEVSDATVFLFSEAGNYINGHVLVVDGGAWRLPGLAGMSAGLAYPDIVLGDQLLPTDIKTGRGTNSKL